MTQIVSILPVVTIAFTLLAALSAIFLKSHLKLRNICIFLVTLASFCSVGLIADLYLKGGQLFYQSLFIVDQIGFLFKIDGLGIILAGVATFLWIITSLYSFGYLKALELKNQTTFFVCFSLSIASTLGVAFSGNLLTLYLFYELLSLVTYPLVTHYKNDEARAAGRKYLCYTIGVSLIFLLPALILTWHYAGTLDFKALGILAEQAPSWVVAVIFFLYLFGFSKAAIMPVHSWLPAAMVAPTPVSGLLHAVAVVKVGVFSVIRVVQEILGIENLANLNVFNISVVPLAAWLAAITILYASFMAINQDNLKARLAYSTIGQLSYITLGILIASPLAFKAASLHIVMHAFGKITLFFAAGALYIVSGQKYISKMSGVGRDNLIITCALFIGALTIIGVPPTGGFVSKWLLLSSALTAENYLFAIIYLLSSFLAAYYLIQIVICVGFGEPAPAATKRELPWACKLALSITSLGCVLLFFFSDFLLKFLER